jgi:hypothetical protein
VEACQELELVEACQELDSLCLFYDVTSKFLVSQSQSVNRLRAQTQSSQECAQCAQMRAAR